MHFSLLQPRQQNFQILENVFLRLLGLVYLIAFASLKLQIVGLIGSHGIAPAAELLTAMRASNGRSAYLDVPSLFWFSPTDRMLGLLCLLGCVAALLLIFSFATRAAAISAYVLYLSLVTIGQPFTGFQWDSLLLESGFLAIFAGSAYLAIAYRFLLFRLMFESGVVKLASGDHNWRNLHALRYHFFTQPLPNPLAYYMHQAPGWLLDSLTLGMFFIELVVPFFLFAYPRRLRQAAAILLISLQLFIAATGNYAFFNLLTIALCLWAIDDSCLHTFRRWSTTTTAQSFPRFVNAATVAIMLLSILQIFGLEPDALDAFAIVNPYGLFAVITTSRTELVIEGSDDNVHWSAYSFYYKPGDLTRSLPVIAPFQPRLDWQMWFAALGTPEHNFWTKTLVYRLLSAEPSVLNLLEPQGRPILSIRIMAYDYTFTSRSERARNGAVWTRKPLGVWFGPVSIHPKNPKN